MDADAEPGRLALSLWGVPERDRARQAERLVAAGVGVLHWDVADGSLGRPGGADVATAQRLTARLGVRSEAHLMVRDPLAHVDRWSALCDVVAVHTEAERWREAVERVRDRGARPAVALSPGVSAGVGAGVVAGLDVDVLVMSVRPGDGGSAFLPGAVDTVRAVRAAAAGGSRVGVDGGVTLERLEETAAAGARWWVSGTALLGAADPAAWLRAAARVSDPPGRGAHA